MVAKTDIEKDAARLTAISEIEVLEHDFNFIETDDAFSWDIAMLAKNFFFTRLTKKPNHEYLGKL